MMILPPSVLNKPGQPADCWSARLVGTTPTDGVKPADQQAAQLARPVPRLAAQHQDDENDNHDENNGSDTDIHEGFLSRMPLAGAGGSDTAAQLGPD